jgi:hypothetical protein
MARNNFLDQITRAREAAEKPSEATERETKPIEQMTDAELQEAITINQRKLLDLQHQEIRERELARVSGAGTSPAATPTLQDTLREKQRGKRRTWR